MDKVKFIYRLQEMFSTLRDRSYQSVAEEYTTVLTGDIDYQKLFDIFCSEWDKSTRPLPSELKKYISKSKKIEVTDLTSEAERDLKEVVKWFNSLEYMYYHKPEPARIKFLIQKNRFTDTMINQEMIKGS